MTVENFRKQTKSPAPGSSNTDKNEDGKKQHRLVHVKSKFKHKNSSDGDQSSTEEAAGILLKLCGLPAETKHSVIRTAMRKHMLSLSVSPREMLRLRYSAGADTAHVEVKTQTGVDKLLASKEKTLKILGRSIPLSALNANETEAAKLNSRADVAKEFDNTDIVLVLSDLPVKAKKSSITRWLDSISVKFSHIDRDYTEHKAWIRLNEGSSAKQVKKDLESRSGALTLKGSKITVSTMETKEERKFLKIRQMEYSKIKPWFNQSGIVLHMTGIPLKTTALNIKDKLKKFTQDVAFVTHEPTETGAYIRLKTPNTAQEVADSISAAGFRLKGATPGSSVVVVALDEEKEREYLLADQDSYKTRLDEIRKVKSSGLKRLKRKRENEKKHGKKEIGEMKHEKLKPVVTDGKKKHRKLKKQATNTDNEIMDTETKD